MQGAGQGRGLSRRDAIVALGGGVLALSSFGCRRSADAAGDPPPALSEPLHHSSLRALAAGIRRGDVSSEEVVRACLDRIQAVNGALNAVVLLDGDAALAAAREADAVRARGEPLGALHGVPVTLKDSLDTAGMVTTAGTAGRARYVPEADATVVARLKVAGAIVLGKTNTPELTLSYETDNLLFGRSNNPYDLSRTPGGSSGGAAAIVASGGSPLDLGSDTAGSIRVPSHFSGVAGIRPTSGRVPRTGHVISFEGHLQSFTSIGPIARHVDDLALVLPLIAGPDGRDPHVVDAPLGDPTDIDLTSLRVAFHDDNGIYPPTDGIRDTVRAAASALESAGAAVEEARPEALEDAANVMDRLWVADGGAWIRRLLEASGTTDPTPAILGQIAEAPAVPAEELTASLETMDRVRARMLGFLERFDAIVCPVVAFPATPHGLTAQADVHPAFSYAYAYNVVGWPGAAVRGGTSHEGLPIGVQVLARPWREDVVLAVAGHLEREMGGWVAPEI